MAESLARTVQVDPAKVAEIATSLHRVVHDEDGLLDLLHRAAAAAVRWLPDADFAGITVQFDRAPFTVAGTDRRVLVVDALQNRLGDGPCLDAQHTGTVVSASGPEARVRWPVFAAGARSEGVLSFLAAPLVVGGVTRGSLNVYSRGEDGFPAGGSDVVAVLCEYVSRGLADYVALSTARHQVDGLREALAGRAPIEQAKGILMAVHQVDADAAFEMLRVQSQNTNTRLRDVAVAFVAARTGPSWARPSAGTPAASTGAAVHEQDFRSAFDHAPHGMALSDVHGVLTVVNPALTRLVGGTRPGPSGLEGSALAEVVHPDDAARVVAALTELRERPLATRTVAARVRVGDGVWVPVRLDVAAVPTDSAAPSHLVVHVEDVTEQHAQAEALRLQALHDPLTGLPNRALFLERLAHGVARHESAGTPLTVLFLDVDDFKHVNDTCGHHGGDVVLQAVAARLRAALRPGDTAARLGGDEFAALCEDADEVYADRVTARLRAALGAPVTGDGTAVSVSVSIGAATSTPEHRLGPDELLRGADNAMYEDKRR